MPRDAQVPQFFRTLRVKNVNQVGVLASVLTVIARHGGSVGDIRTVHHSRTYVTRDIDLIVESLAELDVIVDELAKATTVVELRDEVLTAHVGGKIKVVSQNPIDSFADLGRIYTPGVGEVCRRIQEDPRLADHYTIIPNTCAIISDGSAVLGLGNLGPLAAMPVLEGKCALLAYLADVNAIPIAIKSQNADDIVATSAAISTTFGVIQLEDIASPKCFDVEPRLQEKVDVAVFHDDQHGTAAVVLAALINACHLAETSPAQLRIGQVGLGAAGLAIARAIMHYTDAPVCGCDRTEAAVRRLAAFGGIPSGLEEIIRTCDVVIATTGVARPHQAGADTRRPDHLRALATRAPRSTPPRRSTPAPASPRAAPPSTTSSATRAPAAASSTPAPAATTRTSSAPPRRPSSPSPSTATCCRTPSTAASTRPSPAPSPVRPPKPASRPASWTPTTSRRSSGLAYSFVRDNPPATQ